MTPPREAMSHLNVILERKREEVAALRGSRRLVELSAEAVDAPPTRGFRAALARAGGPHAIAELKKASPSKGVIRADYQPVRFAKMYEAAGASAISCLTDERFFQGSIDDLRSVRAAVALPLLRKDFVIDGCQLVEARAAGADAALLIMAALETPLYEELSVEAARLGLDVLVEVHDRDELERAFASAAPPTILGINNRDLSTFAVDLATTEALAPLGPSSAIVVGESGVETRADVERLARAGAKAVLVGESLMRRADPGEALRELLGTAAEGEGARKGRPS